MKNTKILITGSAGLIGSHLYKSLGESFTVIGLDIKPGPTVDFYLDLKDSVLLGNKLKEIAPNIIIHAGAAKSLMECENNKIDSWLSNVNSTLEIVKFAKENNKKVIYISSDVVFDGEEGNYTEDDKPNPINFYGKTKYASEILVSTLGQHAICRTALVIGNINDLDKTRLKEEVTSGTPLNNQSLLPYYILEKLNRGENVKLPNKIISSPTHVELLSVAIYKIISENICGVFHTVGSEPISRFEFASRIAEFFKLEKKLINVDEGEILAIRPKNLSMNFDKTYKILNLSKQDWNIESILNKLKI